MPLKKKNNTKTILIWSLVAILILLMIISFPTTQNLTEIVVYP